MYHSLRLISLTWMIGHTFASVVSARFSARLTSVSDDEGVVMTSYNTLCVRAVSGYGMIRKEMKANGTKGESTRPKTCKPTAKPQ